MHPGIPVPISLLLDVSMFTIHIAHQEQVVETSKDTIKTSLPQECQLDFKGWCIVFKSDQKCKDQRTDEVGQCDHHGRQILH